MRNSRVLDLVNEFENFKCKVDVYDPWIAKIKVKKEYGITIISKPTSGKYDAIILALSHDEFKQLDANQIKAFGKDNHVLYDVKYLLKADQVDGRL